MHLDAKIARTWLLSVLAVTATATACTSPSTTTTATVLGLSASPNPATPDASTEAGYAWHGSFSVTAADTAGVGGTITSITAQLHESSSGIVIVSGQTDLARIQVHSDSNVLPANGKNVITVGVDYKLPGGGREAVVDVSVALAGNNGLSQTSTVRVTLQ